MSEPRVNASTLPVADERVLVGREPELARFDKILEDRQALLVVVTGGPGVGKTSLLHAIRDRAETIGWNTVPPSATNDFLRVTPETTEADFSNQVQALIVVPSDQSFIEKSPGQSLGETSPEQQPLNPVAEQLRARAPLLLFIDGYRPGPEFADWFQTRFMQDVKRSGTPVIVVAAELPEWATKYLSPQADQIFSLGELEEQAIRQHFTIIGRQISPPMTEEELKAYVGAARNDPELLGRLTRVLRLAPQSETY